MSGDPRPLTVGHAARRAGLTPKALRLYEARGLLPPTRRSESGYRVYSEHDLEVLRFIRQARALSLSLEEIKEILDIRRQGTCPCGRVTQLLDHHLERVERALVDLEALRRCLLQGKVIAESGLVGVQKAVVCEIIESSQETLLLSPVRDSAPGLMESSAPNP
ncbi:MAG: MerR family transcriptional regulator [bacterium]|jgi:DNA-binding transcriptional MerR regulator|nr:MerR family transcriptional regulator [bacterium]